MKHTITVFILAVLLLLGVSSAMRTSGVSAGAAGLKQRRGPQASELASGQYSFDQYRSDFGKSSYKKGSEEYARRKAIFAAKMATILEHNLDASQSWKMGVNHLTDRTEGEVKALRGYKRPSEEAVKRNGVPRVHTVPADFEAPQSVDYRLHTPSVLTAVKDQACGDCWAHSATESIESAFALLTGELHALSQQQIGSCSNMTTCHNDGFGGCEGGDPKIAIQQVGEMGGLHNLWHYPYENWIAVQTPTTKMNPVDEAPYCKLNLTAYNNSDFPPMVTTTGVVALEMNSDAAFVHALATVGPVGIIVAAAPWEQYSGGVWSMPTNTSSKQYAIRFQLDHAVQLVGYGYDFDVNKHYWIVRNSWTPMWGEDGYIRVERHVPLSKTDSSNVPCGIDAPQAVFCDKPSNATVTVCGTSGILSDGFYAEVAAVKRNY